MTIQLVTQELFKFQIEGLHLITETGQHFWMGAYIMNGLRINNIDALFCLIDHVHHQHIDHAANDFMDQPAVGQLGITLFDFMELFGE